MIIESLTSSERCAADIVGAVANVLVSISIYSCEKMMSISQSANLMLGCKVDDLLKRLIYGSRDFRVLRT